MQLTPGCLRLQSFDYNFNQPRPCCRRPLQCTQTVLRHKTHMAQLKPQRVLLCAGRSMSSRLHSRVAQVKPRSGVLRLCGAPCPGHSGGASKEPHHVSLTVAVATRACSARVVLHSSKEAWRLVTRSGPQACQVVIRSGQCGPF